MTASEECSTARKSQRIQGDNELRATTDEDRRQRHFASLRALGLWTVAPIRAVSAFICVHPRPVSVGRWRTTVG